MAFSVLECYLYYPAPHEVLEEMKLVNVEVVTSARAGDWDTAQYWIPIYDDWTRKLQVSMFLRGDELTDNRRAKASVLRDKLELLEHGKEPGSRGVPRPGNGRRSLLPPLERGLPAGA